MNIKYFSNIKNEVQILIPFPTFELKRTRVHLHYQKNKKTSRILFFLGEKSLEKLVFLIREFTRIFSF